MPPRRSWTYLRSSSFSASFAPAAELGWISIRHEDSFRVSHTTNSNIPTPRKWGTTKVSGKPGAIQVSPRPMPQRSSVRPASRRSATRSLLRATHPPPAEPTRRPQPQPSNPHHRHRPHPTLPQNPRPTSQNASAKEKPPEKPTAASNTHTCRGPLAGGGSDPASNWPLCLGSDRYIARHLYRILENPPNRGTAP